MMSDEDALGIQEFYNDIAQEFSEAWYANDSLLPTLRQFLALLPPSPHVLDLGCGAGYESMRLNKLGAKVTGVDISDEAIKIARQKNPNIRFEIQDFRKLSYDLGRFDGVAAIASLIHVDESELPDVLSGIKRVLNDNGYVMIMVVEGQGLSPERSFIEHGGKQYSRYFYLHDRNSISAAAYKAGLAFCEELELPNEHQEYGWKCFIFKMRDHDGRKNHAAEKMD
ncbi:class I SAM-dependent methyltransferase [Oscillospiraceae bacterium WX1]